MELLFYIGSTLVDSSTLEKEKIRIPGYLKAKAEQLKEKHKELLDEQEFDSHFLVGSVEEIERLKQINSKLASLADYYKRA